MKIHNTYLFGRALDKSSWTPGELEKIGLQAQEARALMRGVSRDYIADTLAKAGKLFEPGGKYRKAALAHLKEHITFSEPVIDKSLDIIPEILDKHTLIKRMNMELFLPYALEAPVERRGYEGLIRAMPKGVVLHVGAGNVFLGILDSMVIGFLTKNVNIIKLSSSGSNFINLFMDALKEVDTQGVLSKCAAIVSWKGGSQALEEAALKHVNAVFVWGGYDAVQSYRKIAPIDVRVEGFGPKTSVGVVFESCVENEGMEEVARRAATDASLWDQAACSSLHTLYLVAPAAKHKALAASFLKEAKKHFARLAAELPPGKLSPDEQVEITRARELARVDAALGAASFESSAPKTDWTIIYEKDPVYRVSPLNRVLYVKTVESVEEVLKQLMPMRGYIQTVGVGGSIERKNVLETLAPAGIARVVKLGKMLEEANGSPHDGIFPMMSLVNWLPIEEKPSQLDRLSELVELARTRSPFYGRHFKGVPRITALEDFQQVPFLEKHHVLENTPPDSADLLTSKKVQRGIFFASGGSTGQPKYVFYDQHEYDHTCRMLAFTLEAAGLGEKDVIANLFIAGNLWSSWLSVEKAIAYTKAISVPVGSNLPLENIVGYLEDFKVTAVIGLPSFLVKLAEYVKTNPDKHKLHVRKIFYGGEYVGEEMVKFFKGVFPGVDVRSAGYATADAGVVGFQCPVCVKGQHHLFAFSQFIEFVDQDTMAPVKRGDVGELVVTCLSKKLMPIIRYRVGDLGRWIKPCGCGRKEPMFEILGRCDDRIHVGGAHLFVNDIQNALGKVPDLSFNFQAVIDKKGHKDTLKVRVEVKDAAALARAGELADLLWREIETHCEDLHDSVRMNWLDKPVIEVLKPNTIERIQRTGKIRKVIDKRVKV